MTAQLPRRKPSVTRRPERFTADDRRVITRFLRFSDAQRVASVVDRLSRLEGAQVGTMLAAVLADFSPRHRDLRAALRASFDEVALHVPNHEALSEEHRLLIGAYFTAEYSIESAALFNPSIVLHPDQEGVAAGGVRVLMSMRAVGEGHISSIVFRRGVIDAGGRIQFSPPPRWAYSARPVPGQRQLVRRPFARKLAELGRLNDFSRPVLEQLPDAFTPAQLQAAILAQGRLAILANPSTVADLRWLANSEYELRFPPECLPAEIVIFPATDNESHGMEDLRLVRFLDDDGSLVYYGTYTATNGLRTVPMLLETRDFHTFKIRTLSGRCVKDKGMALFPRRVGGQYVMLSRHDGEKLFISRSDDLYFWGDAQLLHGPTEPWELLQVGNCGSPLETEAGWLLLTHGVGPMRRYCIGALLLDRDDPAHVIGRLRGPLLEPTADEREGYVPNVLYSCGSLIHKGELIIPYAMADVETRFASVALPELLAALERA